MKYVLKLSNGEYIATDVPSGHPYSTKYKAHADIWTAEMLMNETTYLTNVTKYFGERPKPEEIL